jgi:membrane protein required for colicin V production
LSLSLFDIVFLLVLLSFTLLGYLRGALKEFMALLGLVGGFLVATRYAEPLAGQINPLLQDENAARLLAFVLLMVLGYFLGAFLAGFSDLFRRTPEGALSQLLGGLVGFGKGVTVALALLWVVRVYIPAFQDEMADSMIGSWLARLLGYLERTHLL